MQRTIATVLAAVLVLSSASLMAATAESEDDKTLYALGLMLGRDLGSLNLSEEETAMVAQGMSDAALGREPQAELSAYGPKIQAFAQARMAAASATEKEASAKFLDEMAKSKGAEVTESGLIYIEIEPGTGASPSATDTVKVHYHGTLRDGTVFDSSVERGEPISFGLDRVIPCWTEGVQMMKVGGKSKLVCPSDIAYGDRGAGADIKPGAALMFEVELIAIE